MDSVSLLANRIRRFCEAAESLWTLYQVQGPGRVDAACFEPLQKAADQLDAAIEKTTSPAWLAQLTREPAAWMRELQDRVSRLCELSRRCACTPQGLSFVTGEAGLLPRKDQHEAFEQSLLILQ